MPLPRKVRFLLRIKGRFDSCKGHFRDVSHEAFTDSWSHRLVVGCKLLTLEVGVRFPVGLRI